MVRKKNDKLIKLIHDVKSPLTSLLGYADLLAQSKNNKDSKKWLKALKENALKLKQLISEISSEAEK